MKDKYTVKEINSAIMFLKTKNIAHIEYIYLHREFLSAKETERIMYDHATCSHVSVKEVISSAIESGWECE
jgi:hypothetical protein